MQPETQSARCRRSYGKIEDCEQSTPKFEKYFWGRMPPETLVCSTYGGPTFLSPRTPSKPCVTPLRVSCKSGVQNWLTTLFWCSIFFGCSTVRLTCLIYKQLLIGQVKMDSSGPVPTNKQGLLRTKQIQKFCYWHNHLCHFNYSSLLAFGTLHLHKGDQRPPPPLLSLECV